MEQRLRVRGEIPRNSIPCVRGVEVERDAGEVTFTAACKEDMKRLKHLLAFELADIITKDYEEKSLSAYIRAAHPYFLPHERQKVLDAARLAMEKTPPNQRGQYIENRLYAFLADSERLSLEGFLNFRLKEYKSLLKKTAITAVDVYLARREYEEFIALLKLFVATQPQGVASIHVVVEEDESFHFWNQDGEPIYPVCEEVPFDGAVVFTEEDMLLSTLITLAPASITFHRIGNLHHPKILETVMQIFENKVHLCENCALCGK